MAAERPYPGQLWKHGGIKIIGSYDANGSATITTKDPAVNPNCQNIPRPSGSGAGVNALIRGISQIATERLGVLVIMCTNRVDALDPAIRRRAAAEFDFTRPDDAQRAALLGSLFAGVGLDNPGLAQLVLLPLLPQQRPRASSRRLARRGYRLPVRLHQQRQPGSS